MQAGDGATGVDGIALKAPRDMFDDPAWQPKITELLNESFYRERWPTGSQKGHRFYSREHCSLRFGQKPGPSLCQA